jgi:hypothetical protein
MFSDMFDAMDAGTSPREDFYDGYVVNAIIDACYKSIKSKQWEPIPVEWRGLESPEEIRVAAPEFDGKVVIKAEKMPDGSTKRILKDKTSGAITETVS